MKKIIKVLFASNLFVFALVPLSPLLAADTNTQSQTQAAVPEDNSSAEFKRIKSLEGRWTSTTSMFGTPNEQVFVEYEVTSGGSAVLEKIFPGTPQEMISVYYDDNDGKLAMTHYCMMRNRPNLKWVSSSKNSLTLDVVKVDGVKSPDEASMGAITIKFKDKNRISTTCKGNGKGNENAKPMTMDYTRVK